MAGSPTRFPNGVTDQAPNHILKNLTRPWQMSIFEWGTDFDRYRSADWTVTTVGTTPTAALGNDTGGALVLTTSTGASDSIFLDKVGENYKIESGNKLWFAARFQTNLASTNELIIGLQITDTTPLAVSDGIYFHSATGSTNLDLLQVSAATGTTTTTSGVTTLANSTYVEVYYYYDGSSTLYWQVDSATGSASSNGQVAINAPTVLMTQSFGFQNNSAAANTMTVDYVWAAQEITR